MPDTTMTIERPERLAPAPGELHPVQRAFVEQHGLQCGFCTPGLVLTTVDLLSRDPSPDEAAVRHSLAGNICRCTGYQNIVRAVRDGAQTEIGGNDRYVALCRKHFTARLSEGSDATG